MTASTFFSAILLAFTTVRVLAAGSPPAGCIGHWEGAILIHPAQLEVAVEVEIARNGDGAVAGEISFPAQDPRYRPLAGTACAAGGDVTLIYKDRDGDSIFAGRLSKSGESIAGTLREAGKAFPFHLERAARPAVLAGRSPTVARLSPGGDELRSLFARDVGAVRLLLILSPTCTVCKGSARVVQRYVLDAIKDEKLRVYVLWEPIHAEDREEAVGPAASFIPDPRVTHFWDGSRFGGNAFHGEVGVQGSLPWDVILAFDRATEWLTPDRGPLPDFYMHNSSEQGYPEGKRLDGALLAGRVRELLRSHHETSTRPGGSVDLIEFARKATATFSSDSATKGGETDEQFIPDRNQARRAAERDLHVLRRQVLTP
jgi:hypothetical protein